MEEEANIFEDARIMYRTKNVVKKFGILGRRYLGGHDLVRRMDRQGVVLVWCTKCSGYARQRMESKLMNVASRNRWVPKGMPKC